LPLDSEVRDFLQALAAAGAPPRWRLTPQEVRDAFRASQHVAGARTPIGPIEDIDVPVRDALLQARLYRPDSTSRPPLLVYLRGGGWVVGDLDTMDAPLTSVVRMSDCAVLGLAYRLAPEHRFPTQVNDAADALVWAASHAWELGLDPERLGAGGDSAGGNLAAAAALRARDAGSPELKLLALVYPVLDHSFETDSWRELGEGHSLTRPDMEWYWRQYLGDAKGDDPDASPARAADLRGLPPTLLITAEYDPLRSEDEEWGRRLVEASVPVRIVRYPGVIHGFFRLASIMSRGRIAIAEVAGSMRAVLLERDLSRFDGELVIAESATIGDQPK
jgi:acetyl esterase